jgi:hypothetical protein
VRETKKEALPASFCMAGIGFSFLKKRRGLAGCGQDVWHNAKRKGWRRQLLEPMTPVLNLFKKILTFAINV